MTLSKELLNCNPTLKRMQCDVVKQKSSAEMIILKFVDFVQAKLSLVEGKKHLSILYLKKHLSLWVQMASQYYIQRWSVVK